MTRFCIRIMPYATPGTRSISHYEAGSVGDVYAGLVNARCGDLPFNARNAAGDTYLLVGVPADCAVEVLLWDYFVQEQEQLAAEQAAAAKRQQLEGG